MEKWKDIAGYSGLYKISNHGNVYSCISRKTLKQVISSTGYSHVTLYLHGKAKTASVHILVANAFLDTPSGAQEINHKDGVKTNNNADNLEWVTKSENQRHAIKLGLRPSSPMKGKSGDRNPRSKIIYQYNLDGTFVRKWVGITETARAMNCSASTISACLNRRKRTGAGYLWRYEYRDNIKSDIPSTIMSGSNRGRRWVQKKQRPMKKILQKTKSGDVVTEWENYKVLCEKTGYDSGNIYNCINGRIKTAYGYTWEYAT